MENILKDIALKLKNSDNIYILSHQNPDGDTMGSAFSLYYSLRQLGKNAKVLCTDEVPKKFENFKSGYENLDFEPELIVSVDIAATQLLGVKLEQYKDKIDICIDHHRTNGIEATLKYVDINAAATCEIMYQLLVEMNINFTKQIADCVYTGMCTDTGCFKFSNVTSKTLRIAADLIDLGCDYAEINRLLFDTKTKGRLEMEKQVLENMEFYCDNKVALIVISQEMLKKTGIDSAEIDGISAMPRQVEGVEIGITMREREEGGYKVSLRTNEPIDASKICQKLGGGGHIRAAGCLINRELKEAKERLLEQIIPLF